jgi:hypothetical protein
VRRFGLAFGYDHTFTRAVSREIVLWSTLSGRATIACRLTGIEDFECLLLLVFGELRRPPKANARFARA